MAKKSSKKQIEKAFNLGTADDREAEDVLRKHVEKLGLAHKTSSITLTDQVQLRDSLRSANELGLANYVQELKDPGELEDLIVNTLYG